MASVTERAVLCCKLFLLSPCYRLPHTRHAPPLPHTRQPRFPHTRQPALPHTRQPRRQRHHWDSTDSSWPPSGPGIPSRDAPASLGISSEPDALETPSTAVATTIDDHFPRLVRNDRLLTVSSFFFFLSSISRPPNEIGTVGCSGELVKSHKDCASKSHSSL
jgi:hypothetical protein